MGRNITNPVRNYFKNNENTDKWDFQRNQASNLEKHISKNHADEWDSLKKEKEYSDNRKPKKLKKSNNKETDDFSNSEKTITITIDKEKLLKACTELVTVHGCAYNLMEYSGFKKIILPILDDLGNPISINAKNIRRNNTSHDRTKKRHTAENIKDLLINALDEFQISIVNIHSITCDNGSKMVKTMEIINEKVC
ncbi:hypothetical protein BB559_006601 [Furculomyces boomerangus]|uniref:Uncharacterized protein n=1 Tax=Furculomyces boomerangus TaxID=61424 RepID=A0A2T9Y1K4_9FUNG|nr:hypothetical protein BB559_006601 [Furculomyces boomerangus]